MNIWTWYTDFCLEHLNTIYRLLLFSLPKKKKSSQAWRDRRGGWGKERRWWQVFSGEEGITPSELWKNESCLSYQDFTQIFWETCHWGYNRDDCPFQWCSSFWREQCESIWGIKMQIKWRLKVCHMAFVGCVYFSGGQHICLIERDNVTFGCKSINWWWLWSHLSLGSGSSLQE